MTDCPSSQQLLRFLAGEIFDETQRQEIDDHVQNCASCVDTLAELSASEATFVEQLRAVPVEPFKDESACDDVVQRVIALSDAPEFSDDRDDLSASKTAGEASNNAVQANAVEQIGPYEIIRRLGHGGMGTVYLARHVHLNRAVALKVLRKVSDPDSIARFVHEMHAIGAIDHPNIVSASDSGIADGQHFLVMQLIPGIDGSRLSRHVGPLPVADACEIVRQAAIGLQHIHELGMVHRDIKPGNLMLQSAQRSAGSRAGTASGSDLNEAATADSTAETRTAIVKILDLGLALIDESTLPDAKRLTATGQVLGTLDYMAPEQCLDSRNVDIRADIYGLGATLFKLLTGDVPYPDSEFDTFGRKFTAILNLSPATVSRLRDDVPESLSEFVDTLLARNPDARPPTPIAVAEKLAPFAKDHQLTTLVADTTGEINASEAETNANTATRLGLESSIVPMSPAELAELRGDSRRNKGTLVTIGLGFVGLTVAVIWAAVILRDAARPTNDAPLIPQGPRSPDIAAVPFDETEAVSTRESWAEWLETESVQTNSLGMKLTLIPPGEFTMGDDTLTRSTRTGDERIAPEHHVAITRPYVIGVTEVTQAEYREVMGNEPSEFAGQDDWPVEKITWDDAVRFCNALSQRDGLPLYYRIEPLAITIIGGTGYRLPTEAEWEFAARAGSETSGLSNDAPSTVSPNDADGPSSVLSGEPNAFGLFHTAGNVSEFCQDGGEHGLRSTASATDPSGLTEGTLRVVKGGDFAQQQIAAAFKLVYPFRPCFRTGFRVARTVPDPHEEPETDLPLIRQQLVDENLTGGGFLPVRLDELATGTWEPLFDSPESLNGNREATWDDGTIDIQSNDYVFIESGRRTERHLIFRAEVRFVKGYSARLEISTAPIDKRMIAILKPGRIILGLKTGDGAKYIHCHSDFRPDIDRYVDIALVRNGNELAVYINGIRRCGSAPGQFHNLENGLTSMKPGIGGVSTNGGLAISFRNVRVMAFKRSQKTPPAPTDSPKSVESPKNVTFANDSKDSTWAQTILLGAEYGGDGELCSRWTKTPRLSVFGGTQQHRQVIADTVKHVNETLSNTPIKRIELLEPNAEDADIRVYFARLSEFSGLARKHNFPYAAGNIGYFYTRWNGRNEIYSAIVMLATDRLTGNKLRHDALEEITQSLGLTCDSPAYSDSIFFEKGSDFGNAVRLSSRDKQLVSIFYNHIKPGARRTDVREAIRKYWNAPKTAEPSAPPKTMPKRLDDLAGGEWIALFDDAADVRTNTGEPGLSETRKWSDGTVTLTSLAQPTKWIGVCENQYRGSRMILRGTVELTQGMTASLGFVVPQKSGAADRKVLLRLGSESFELACGNHISSPTEDDLQPGPQDLALVRYDDTFAVYLNGAKAIDVPANDDSIAMFIAADDMRPQLAVYSLDNKSLATFSNVRLMILN